MADSVTNSTYIPNEYSYTNKKQFSSEMDQDAFMKLFLEQLKHQDPMSPMDNTQFMQNTALMTMVERLTKMQSLMEEANSSLLNLPEYESLIGKSASYTKVTEDEVTGEKKTEQKDGTISAVKLVDGKIYFQIGEDTVTRNNIKGLESKGMTNDSLLDNTLKYTQMIGKRVSYLEEQVIDKDGKPETTDDQYTDTVSKTGIITSFSLKDGKLEFTIDKDKKVTMDKISGIEVADNVPMDNTLKYAQMIGYKVVYNELVENNGKTENVEKTATIKAMNMKNGLIEFLLDNDKKIKPNEIVGLEVQATPPTTA
ncbi:flagellar hook assembly protein FlgD [Brevibacillus sp. SYSU BS000544]|uniref:flagellar hook assembly protein FlgD n=1 Tax=Brevibacillus sp. SYSU BS000544 TaxID=3416443 RepID=UPI003CE5C78E